MAKARVMSAKTANGGTITISEREQGGFRIEIKQGFKETPAERAERIRLGRRGGFHTDKRVEKRSAVKRSLKDWRS